MGHRWMISLLVLPLLLQAESYEEFLKGTSGEFESYKETQNREFKEFVKKQWEEFRVFAGNKPYEEPKLTKPPIAPKPKPEPGKEKKAAPVKIKPAVVKIPPKAPEPEKPKPKEKTGLPLVSFDFYGTMARIPYDKSLQISLGKPDKESVTRVLEKLLEHKHDTTLQALQEIKKRIHLNDWGYYSLIHRFAAELTKKSNDANMLTWFFLLQSGLDSKVAYNGSELFLFGATRQKLFQNVFINENGRSYYILDPSGRKAKIGSVYTFKGNYPKSEKTLDFGVNNLLFSDAESSRDLAFSYGGKKYAITVLYNPHTVDFYATAPQTQFETYFDADVEYRAKSTLLNELAPLLKGRDEADAVNFLLRFVQSAFVYKTDDLQFKREKPLFPEETLHYPYSDCEDRSILFAYLVRQLLGLEVVALHYPGHLATAVKMRTKVAGDYVIFKGKRYVVADPTYIGANAGMTMPQFKKSSYSVVEMKL